MKRLRKKADHDVDNRDAALVIVGNDIYENSTHAMCLNDIYKKLGKKFYINLQYRPDIEQFQYISDKNQTSVILAHKVDVDDAIYYFYGYDNGEDMSDEQIVEKLKKIFPRREIKNDLEHELTTKELNKYDGDQKIDDMYESINKEKKERGSIETELGNCGFEACDDIRMTNGSCFIMDNGNGLYVDTMPDYLQNFKELQNGFVQPQYLDDFIEAVKNEQPSQIAIAFRNHGYEIDTDKDEITYRKYFNNVEVEFSLNHSNKFDIEYVSDDDTETYLVELLETSRNIIINDEVLNTIDRNLDVFCNIDIDY